MGLSMKNSTFKIGLAVLLAVVSQVSAQKILESSDKIGGKIFAEKKSTESATVSQTSVGKKSVTAVSMGSVKATKFSDGIWITWESESEVSNLGYNVYRLDAKGNKTPVNNSLIAGSAIKYGLKTEVRAGLTYAWRDIGGLKGASYIIEALDLDGTVQTYGPFNVVQASPREKQPVRSLKFDEVNSKSKTFEQKGWSTESNDNQNGILAPSGNLQRQREIANMPGIKLGVKTDGWHSVPRAQLMSLGIDPLANPTGIQLYTDGIEQALNINEDGGISFYGKGLDTPMSNTRMYYLINGTNGMRAPVYQLGVSENTPSLTSYSYTVERRDRPNYAASILNGATENYFGAVITGASATAQTLNLPTPTLTGFATLEIAIQGLTYSQHNIAVKLNGTFLQNISFDSQNNQVTQINVPANMLVAGTNTITLQSNLASGDTSVVDYIRLTYQRRYRAAGNFIRFSVPADETVEVDGFTSGKLRILDITNPSQPKLEVFGSESGPNGYGLTLTATGGGTRVYEISSKSIANTVSEMSANIPSTISNGQGQADLLVIAPDSFRTAIEPLRVAREAQGIVTRVVSIDDIYDEYSFGVHSSQAITDFITDATATWSRKPNYVLMVGDSSYDPKNYEGRGNFDIVPTAVIDTALMESHSDDGLADFNGDGVGELMFGRFPARTAAEVTTMVNKTLAYQTQAPQNGVLFVADQPYGYDFGDSARRLRLNIPASSPVSYYDRDLRTSAEQRTDIVNLINAGQRITVYTGHGSVSSWTGSSILRRDEAALMTNNNKLSFFVLLTCLNGYSSYLLNDTISEAYMKSNGGSVAVFSSTGETTPDGQELLGAEILHQLYSNPNMTIGQASRASKYATGIMDIRRTWQLLGDPTLVLR